MNIELIKSELHCRVQQLMEQRRKTQRATQKVLHKLPSWSDKVADTEDLIHKVYHTLYEVLQKQGIHFKNDIEKEGFVSLMEPTVHDLVINNIED